MKKEKKENLTMAEVEKNIFDFNEKLRKIRFGTSGSKAKNVKERGNIRRNVARMETMKTAFKKAA